MFPTTSGEGSGKQPCLVPIEKLIDVRQGNRTLPGRPEVFHCQAVRVDLPMPGIAGFVAHDILVLVDDRHPVLGIEIGIEADQQHGGRGAHTIGALNGHAQFVETLLGRLHGLLVVAGMEGALASVVGGLTDKPIIAVPTSIGYGANFGGVSALLGMLTSCASGIGVVNIDNGFGAACMASKINKI